MYCQNMSNHQFILSVGRIVRMINVLVFVLCLVTSSNANQRIDDMQSSTIKEDLELERQLKLLNKPPIKSIHTKFGYVVDCIDINKQPAFEHPLLKNHKLQRKPGFKKSTGKSSMNNTPTKLLFGLEKGMCPTGTVPIRRTTKDDLVRAKSLLNSHILSETVPGSHVAVVTLETSEGPYNGVRGTNNIYGLKVMNNQSSASHLWVRNGPMDTSNKIVIGWHVAPQLYGNDATYIYSAWTSDNFKKTGCFNLLCLGFVQIAQQIYLGARVSDNSTSTYGGPTVEIEISLSQNPTTKDWWLFMEKNYIGYFPAALFTNLTSADQVGWGGRTTTSISASPPMGSGYFPDETYSHACYFTNVAFQNATGDNYGPEIWQTETFTDNSDCFGVDYYGDNGGTAGYSLEFGGPGGICGF